MPNTTDSSLLENIGVRTVETEQLVPNPHNPRVLFDRAPMDVLEASIQKVGVLVPLTVYWDNHREKFVILDGQRRWTCALSLGLKTVPVNQVAEPTLVQNIVTMFQIHKLREDWELMPTALKVEVLIVELDERNEARLASLTGLDKSVVSRCKKLLSYSKKYQDMMLNPDPKNRIKADFFIELYAVKNDKFVKKQSWFKTEEFVDRMLAKYLDGTTIKSVVDFRKIKQHINNAVRSGEETNLETRFRDFVFNVGVPIDTLVIKSAEASAEALSLSNNLERLIKTVHDLDVERFYGEEELWKNLEKLQHEVSRKLDAANRRLKA